MRWLYTAIIASSAILTRGEAIGQAVDVSLYGATPNSGQNSSPSVARAIDFSLRHHRSKILFKRGRYDFWPQGAVIRHLFISNHDGVAERAVAISIEHVSGLELDGNGSEFVFHDSSAARLQEESGIGERESAQMYSALLWSWSS